MVDSMDVKRWLDFAREDLRAARRDLGAQPVLCRHVVYNCQQAAEKALKAILIASDRRFKPTHNLIVLADQLIDILPELGKILRELDWLTNWVVNARYPDDFVVVNIDDCHRALKLAGKIVQLTEAHITCTEKKLGREDVLPGLNDDD